MKKRRTYWCTLLTVIFITGKTYAAVPESFIEKAFKAQESLVSIMAVAHTATTEPSMTAARGQKTNHILVAKKARITNSGQTGGGIILTRDGVIVTNFHTIQGATMVIVKLYTGETFYAKITELKPNEDLAFLKISPPFALTPIATADSNTVSLGDEIAVIGNSVYLKQTIAGGKITGIGNSRQAGKAGYRSIDLIQLNVRLYNGDSGDAVITKEGRLIGMVSAALKTDERITFAIPINKIKILGHQNDSSIQHSLLFP